MVRACFICRIPSGLGSLETVGMIYSAKLPRRSDPHGLPCYFSFDCAPSSAEHPIVLAIVTNLVKPHDACLARKCGDEGRLTIRRSQYLIGVKLDASVGSITRRLGR